MNYSFLLAGIAALFLVLILLAMQLGKRWGRHADEKSSAGAVAIEASVFALLGLLVAFAFSGAAQRMAERRNLIVQEVNAMGTAWLRIDLLETQYQPKLREEFRRYVDARSDYYRHVADLDQREVIGARVGEIQREIWRSSVDAVRNGSPPLGVSYLGAVNEMFDVSTTQTVAQNVHPPIATYAFLGALVLVCASFIGVNLGPGRRGNTLHQILYAVVMTGALYIIVDFEFPRVGLIRIDQNDVLLASQRQSMVDPASAR